MLPPPPITPLVLSPPIEQRQKRILMVALFGVVVLFAAGFLVARQSNTKALAPGSPALVVTNAIAPPSSVKAKTYPASSLKPKPKPVLPTTAVARPAAFCAAAAAYSVTDVIVLADRVVADPDAFDASYAAMLANAPGEIAIPLRTLGPLSHAGADLVRKGTLTTPTALRDWLAHTAPADQVTAWIVAQQTVVRVVQQRCG